MAWLRRLVGWLLHTPHDVDPDFQAMQQWGRER